MTIKILITVCFALFTHVASAALDENIFIQGKIGNTFDKTKVKVTDSHGQKYWLPKSAFPKEFKFDEGAMFNIEVPESTLEHLLTKK